jgi:hypothetical protein
MFSLSSGSMVLGIQGGDMVKQTLISSSVQTIVVGIVVSSILFAAGFAFRSNAKLEVALDRLDRIQASLAINTIEMKECKNMIAANTTDILLLKERARRGNL